MENKKEKFIEIKITLFDVAVMALSFALAMIISYIITKDGMAGFMIGLFSVLYRFATSCITVNPHVKKEESEDKKEVEIIYKSDGIQSFVMNIVLMLFGLLMVNGAEVWYITQSGDERALFAFGDSENIRLCGWIIVLLTLYCLLKPVYNYFMSKLRGKHE